ncbi:hypothetical protein [Streptomyces sp. NBC_00996]|uniref:hypothetical protein n=1 Tax=Streptomyces sp. NBC_00996 TaxID=2903710 RepID=UPI0038656BFA|nr:hypothetical protein OG390_17300 [Streptomyces sp. NBC_00996]
MSARDTLIGIVGQWAERIGCAPKTPDAVVGAFRDEVLAEHQAEPLIVSRYDVAMEPAPEEEPVLTVGAVAEDGRPVALLFDLEARAKVAGWLAPSEDAVTFVPRTERSHWVSIADALNAAHSAGMAVGIDLDGTLTDHHMWSVIWDRAAERWTVAGYEVEDPCRPCGCPKRFNRHAEGCPTLPAEEPQPVTRTGRCYLNGDVLFLSDAVIQHPITKEPHVMGWTRKTNEREWKPTAVAQKELKCNRWQDVTVDKLDDPDADMRRKLTHRTTSGAPVAHATEPPEASQ